MLTDKIITQLNLLESLKFPHSREKTMIKVTYKKLESMLQFPHSREKTFPRSREHFYDEIFQFPHNREKTYYKLYHYTKRNSFNSLIVGRKQSSGLQARANPSFNSLIVGRKQKVLEYIGYRDHEASIPS